jgi:diguanylate cyclase (GGDEF)-like protein
MKNPSQILVVGPNDVGCAVHAMQSGAKHYWPTPFQLADFQKLYEQGKFSINRGRFGFHREGTLLQIIKEIALTMELDGLANILVDSAMELTSADGGSILLLDEKSNMLVMKAVRGLSATELSSEIFGLPEKEFYEILSKREPIHLHPDPPVFLSTGQKVESMIVTPTWWKDQPLAELVMVKYQGSPDFTREDFKVLSLLNEEIAGAVHNAIIHYKTKELTIKDDLTEAYNRRYFEQYLDEEFIRAKRYGSNVSLIFFDVDNLKEVNVKYGHLTGSKTLQEVAHRIILTVRGIDKVVRYGGDEFCIVLPETDTPGAYQVADRIRSTISMRPFRVTENIQVTLTGSIGIASFPAHASSKEDLVRQADRAMFIIKNQSKNAIAVAPPISN